MALTYRGSNLAGGDVVYSNYPQATGPVQASATTGSGGQYLFVSNKDVDYCVSTGMNTFRLVFAWEAVQPTPKALLSALTGNYKAYLDRLKALVDYITVTKGCTVILDVHGGADATFAAYFGVKVGQLYNGVAVQDLLVDLWKQMAALYKGNSKVMFGITNEPTNLPTMTWFACAQAVINGIRSTGATNKILMPGNYFTGSGSWTSTSQFDTGSPKRSNAYGWENANGVGKPLVDPASNLAVQVHMYFDANSGGGATDIPSDDIGVQRLKPVVDWARGRGLQVMLCEIALSATNSIAAAAWKKTLDYMEANKDVLLGWQWWAYGPPVWWGTYRFSLCPTSNYTVDSAQVTLIKPALAAPVTPPPPPTGPTQAQYDALKAERDALVVERDGLKVTQASLIAVNDGLVKERNALQIERDALTVQAASDATDIAGLNTRLTTVRTSRDILVAQCKAACADLLQAADTAENTVG